MHIDYKTIENKPVKKIIGNRDIIVRNGKYEDSMDMPTGRHNVDLRRTKVTIHFMWVRTEYNKGSRYHI